jgi:chemotaxis protein CheY-P-specific phosphatase CheC
MNAALDSSLREAAVATFEQVVFLLPDTPPDEQQQSVRVHAVATIAFSGPADGVLQVWACEGLLPHLTANMLGEESVNEMLQLDALGEIANIICGQIFPHLEPLTGFQQTPPQVAVCSARSHDAPASVPLPVASIQLGLERSRADVMLFLFDDAA